MTLHGYVQLGGTEKVLSSSAQCITYQIHSNNLATPIRHSADASRTSSATRGIVLISIDRCSALCAGSRSEIQQIRSQINLGTDLATVNHGKLTESTAGTLHCNFTLQSNVSTVTYDKADAERNEPKLLVSFHALICHKCDSSCD